MNKHLSFLFLLLALHTFSHAQTAAATECRKQVISDVIAGYNSHQYRAMRRPWIGIAKLIVTQKKLRKQFDPFYTTYGKATIDTITHASDYTYTVKLRMEKKPEERIYLKFLFSEKGKIQGMGFDYPPMIYRKSPRRPLDNDRFAAKIDSLMARKYLKSKTHAFNGSVLIIDEGAPVYQQHFGAADFSRGNPINDSTLYELASVSKQFTATAILILAERGQLRLSDTVQRFIPGFPYPNITIEHLLTHTSGLPDYEALLAKKWDRTRFATNQDVVDQLIEYHPKVLFQPNEAFEYSNTGFVILSLIIEKASGMSYNAFLEQEIFSPLKMRHTRVYNTRRVKNELLENYAYGYVYSKESQRYVLPDSTKQYQMVVYQDAITGDGTVNSCTADLILWEQELLHPTLVSPADRKRSFTPHILNNGKPTQYGYGFFLNGGGSTEPLAFHTGGWPGYVCILMHFPELHRAVVILSNNEYWNFSALADDIAAALVEEF